jgi:hypothetical protein
MYSSPFIYYFFLLFKRGDSPRRRVHYGYGFEVWETHNGVPFLWRPVLLGGNGGGQSGKTQWMVGWHWDES